MDDRLKKLKEIQQKKEEIEIAKRADRLMAEGGTDSDSAIAQLDNDGNAARQIYGAVGHETLQGRNDAQARRIMENAKPTLPYHDNQSHN
ncbi:MAG TPA: hypothetical protein VN381_13225 [Anaerovoracaceae bacterium]|nr:hypothetical protein [Anaerovoracaceae bacterium]